MSCGTLGLCLYDGGDDGVWLGIQGQSVHQSVQSSEGKVSTTLIFLEVQLIPEK